MITKQELVQLVISIAREVETEDPIDWGMLPIGEDGAYFTVATSVVENFLNDNLHEEAQAFSDREFTMMASITKLVVENFVLNLQIDRLRGNNG